MQLTLTLRKKKKQQSHVFFGVIFYVYTNVDNRERPRASYWKQKRKKNMEIQSGGEKMKNGRGQPGENERQWKIWANMNTTQETKYWVSTYDNSSIKIMCK